MKTIYLFLFLIFFYSCSSSTESESKESIINSFFDNYEKVDFVLIDFESKQLLKNTKFELHRVIDYVYDAPSPTELVNKLKTDKDGVFQLTKGFLREKDNLFIRIKDQNKGVKIGYNKEKNSIYESSKKTIFGSTAEIATYNLTSNQKEVRILSTSDTIVSTFEKIELYAKLPHTEGIRYDQQIINYINTNKELFEKDQIAMWDYVWKKFEVTIEGDTLSEWNVGNWIGIRIRFASNWQKFKLDMNVLKEYIPNIKSPSKRYYFLLLTTYLASSQKQKEIKVDQKLFKWLKTEIEMFYEKNEQLDLFIDVKKNSGDRLKEAYHFYSDWST